MKKIALFVAIFFLSHQYTIAQDLTIRNGNIIDVESGTVSNGCDIIVKDGVIQSIKKTKRLKIKAGDIDATGKYIVPGLIDSHVHWANFAPTFKEMKQLSASYLANGITTVRDVGGNANILKQYIEHVNNGEIVGPQVYYCSFWAGANYFKQRNNDNPNPEPTATGWSREISATSDFSAFIKDAKECGAIGLKLYNDIDKTTLNKITEECRKHGMKIWSHFAIQPANTVDVVESGVEVVSHIYYADKDKSIRDRVFKEMVRRDVKLDPTLKLCLENNMDNVVEYTQEAVKAGVKFVAGTDWAYFEEDGIRCAFIDELKLYHDKCGMTNIDVLRSATIYGAEILGLKDKVGVIKEGARADMIIVKDNPLLSLNVLENIEQLYVKGVKIY